MFLQLDPYQTELRFSSCLVCWERSLAREDAPHRPKDVEERMQGGERNPKVQRQKMPKHARKKEDGRALRPFLQAPTAKAGRSSQTINHILYFIGRGNWFLKESLGKAKIKEDMVFKCIGGRAFVTLLRRTAASKGKDGQGRKVAGAEARRTWRRNAIYLSNLKCMSSTCSFCRIFNDYSESQLMDNNSFDVRWVTAHGPRHSALVKPSLEKRGPQGLEP